MTQPAPKPAPGLSPSARSVLPFLADHRSAHTQQIMRQIHVSTPAAIRKVIYELMAAGFINRVDGGNRCQLATYELSSNGKREISKDHAYKNQSV